MILVDRATGSRELLPYLTNRPLSLQAEIGNLQFGDFAFEGYSPDGSGQRIMVGIERKTVSDMLACIDDARYTGHQRIGMAQMYQSCYLIIEGPFRPHSETGILMQGKNESWYESKFRGMRTAYNKLRRYLLSVSLSGVHVIYTRDENHTAWDIHELFHYYQKRKHDALLQMQRFNIPSLSGKPSLVRRWAFDLPGIGETHSEIAERVFKTPIRLATAGEREWLGLPGIGVKTAQAIVRAILGRRE